jgi:hypothetical protein
MSNVTTLISFHRENAKKNGNITVQIPHGETLKGILFNKIYPTCSVLFQTRNFLNSTGTA